MAKSKKVHYECPDCGFVYDGVNLEETNHDCDEYLVLKEGKE